jgi:histidinol phosphatase-like enzyme
MKVIYVDIDETICNRESSTDFGTTHDYTKAKPIQNNIDKINELYDQGNTIVYWTARGSRKQIDWTNLTQQQLSDWGCKMNSVLINHFMISSLRTSHYALRKYENYISQR